MTEEIIFISTVNMFEETSFWYYRMYETSLISENIKRERLIADYKMGRPLIVVYKTEHVAGLLLKMVQLKPTIYTSSVMAFENSMECILIL